MNAAVKYAARSLPTECPACHGKGQTRATETVVVPIADGKFKTIKQGSGCPNCLGLGQLSEKR